LSECAGDGSLEAMKRRDVMKLGALAVGAGVGAPGCAVPRMLGTLKGEDGAAAFNAMLDEQLGKLDKPGLLHRLVSAEVGRPLSAEAQAKIDEKDVMFRSMLGTLMITQGFRDLPAETQAEPAVQARMWKHLDQIGSMPFAVSEMLASLDETQRSQIQHTLRKRPDLPMAIGEALDAKSGQAGLSQSRRMQLRSMMSQTSFRLRHSDPASVIDEYVTKVERLRARDERDAQVLDAATKVGERDFWQTQHLLAGDPGGPATAAPAPVQPSVPEAGNLTVSARAAAARGDCKTVEILGKRVHEIDPA
jgi:hypothetical protein